MDLLQNALGIAKDNKLLRQKSLKTNLMLQQIFYYLENQRVLYGVSVPKRDVIRTMINNINSLDDEVNSLAIHNLDDEMIRQVRPGPDWVEFSIFVYRETEKLNVLSKEYFDLLLGSAYWFMEYSKRHKIFLPNSDKLAEILKNENFTQHYQPKCATEKNNTTKRQNEMD
jgi:hypothetical protein